MKAYRSRSDLPGHRRLKAAVGSCIGALHPTLADKVRRRPFSGAWGAGGRFVRNALLAEAVHQADHETFPWKLRVKPALDQSDP